MQPETTGHRIRSIGSYTGYLAFITALTGLMAQYNSCREDSLRFKELKASVGVAQDKTAKVSKAQQQLANDSVPLAP